MTAPDPRIAMHDGPALLDSRDAAFIVTADLDGNIHIIDNMPAGLGVGGHLPFVLRDVADWLESV